MSKKILVALDGSDGGKRALAAAVAQAKLTQADLVLTYVIDWTPYSFHTPQELEERHKRRESEIQRAKDTILARRGQSRGYRRGVEGRNCGAPRQDCRNDSPDLAKEYDGVGQIYIGRRGESLVHSMIFGSVTAALIQTSEVPVTVVP